MKKFRSLIAAVLLLAFCLLGAACGDSAALDTPQGFDIDDENTLTWAEVNEARQYDVEIVNVQSTETATAVTRRNSYSLSELAEGDYEIRVRAIGGSRNALQSEWSDPVRFHKDFESGLVYTLINQNSEYAVTRVGSAEGIVTIEDVYRGKPVTRIEDSAFRAANRVTQVIIGKNVRSIGEKAFYNCAALTRVEIPDSVTEIGSAAFQVCNKLESVRLSSSLTALPDYLFAYCRALKEVQIPEGVQSISESAFYACSALTALSLPDSLTTIGEYAFAEMDALQSITFGSRISSIGANAFYSEDALGELNFAPLAEGVQLVIGENAFAKCVSLQTVTLPEGLSRIDGEAFYLCDSLSEVDLPESLTAVGDFVFHATALFAAQEEGDGLVYADNWLVGLSDAGRATLKRLVGEGEPAEGTAFFRDDVVGVASNSFVNCPELQTVTFPSSMKYICSYAFYGNPVLYSVIINRDGGNVQNIGEYAFAGNKSLSFLRLGEGLVTIGSYAFYGCSQLNNSNTGNSDDLIPSTVRRIGTYAFNETGFFSGNSAEDTNGVVYVGDWVVGYSEKQSTVTLKSEVKGIADYAFYGDDVLESVQGLNRVSVIGRGAFMNCYSLAQANLGDNLTTIREYTFRNCSALFRVAFPARLETIEQFAFENCQAFQSADLSATRLKTVGMGAFYGAGVNELSLPDTLETIGDYAFYALSITDLTIPDSVKTVGIRAFALCASLENVNFGGNIVSIGDYAFRGDGAITSVVLPESLERLGSFAFYECPALKSVKMGENLKSIGDYAFAGSALESIILPEHLQSVGACAFIYCEALSYARLPASGCTYGKNAFYGCYFLTIYAGGTDGSLWSGRWNPSYCPVVLGCTFSEEGYLVSVTAGNIVNPYAFFGYKPPVREGYAFAGWATHPAGEVAYDIDGVWTAPAGTVLYAVWTEVPPESETPPEGEQTPQGGETSGEAQ